MPNRLARSTSPYLQQHADNPVDWFEWGEEAFAEARRRDVPVLVSVGYAACHWCHVMAHESFEDPATAAVMNERFVNVKVDREERPDVDAVYMAATQAMTGHGGWPMTVFATPDGEPFWCGTYFPPRPVGGSPSFRQVLDGIAGAWREGRDDVRRNVEALRDAVGREWVHDGAPALGDAVDAALEALRPTADPQRGGFGGAPKFPPSMVLEWLLRHHARTGRGLDLATPTLVAMARGGMYDQLGGGFARYSVDADWVVPHFEKMLYDNALLLRVYAHWARLSGHPLARRVVRETAAFLLAELRTPEGGFASALDADSPGDDGAVHEGAFYVWSPAQLHDVLGDDDAAWAAHLLGVTEAGTFEHGTSVLQLRHEPDDPERWADVRARLLAARAARPRPARDDKVVAAWNGLAIAALADAGVLLEEDAWVEAAVGAAELLARVHLHGGRVLRTSRDGVAGTAPGVLEDHADVAEGFLALYQATGDDRWYRSAADLLEEVLTAFGEPARLYDTADHSTDPVVARLTRPREVADGPTPSGQAAAAGALLTYAALSGSTRHREAAEQALGEPLAIGARVPRAAGWALAVAEAVLDGPREVALVDDDGTLRRVAAASGAPGLVVAAAGDVPLLLDRPGRGGPTAYVCRGFVCERPTTDPVELARQLDPRG